jgi:hypothetical protein
MGAAAVKQELSIPPVALGWIFCAEGISAINPHGLFDGEHAHLGGVILG